MSKMYSIKSACNEIGMSEVYLRRMILQGKIPTVKTHVTENVWRHEMTEEVVMMLKKKHSSGTHTLRTDGRNKFTVYLNSEETSKLVELLKMNKLDLLIERANKKKYVSVKNKQMKKQEVQ